MLNELNHVIDYIENHLTDDELSLEIISEYAGVSDYHFRKVFFYLSGLTLIEYIKSRKLSEASMDLLEKAPVKACTWAIFPNEGSFPSTLQETMAKIYS
jgi:AraC-like DNA-binding protein